MKPPKFEPRLRQAIDLPNKLRYNLYVFHEDLADEFDAVELDHKLLKFIADLPDKKTRTRLSEMKTSTRLDFDMVEAAPCLKMFETFFPCLGVDEELALSMQSTTHLLEVTTGEKLGPQMPGFQMVQFATAFLAREIGGLLIDPLAYKIYAPGDESLHRMLALQSGGPSLRALLSVIQSTLPNGRQRTTSHGLCRFGIPEFDLEKTAADRGEALIELTYLLAQSLFEDVIQAGGQGAESYSFNRPLTVFLPGADDVKKSVPVSLRLHRTPEGRAVSLDYHGRQGERDQTLSELLEALGLCG